MKDPQLALIETMVQAHGPIVISPSLGARVRESYGEAWLKQHCIINEPLPLYKAEGDKS